MAVATSSTWAGCVLPGRADNWADEDDSVFVEEFGFEADVGLVAAGPFAAVNENEDGAPFWRPWGRRCRGR